MITFSNPERNICGLKVIIIIIIVVVVVLRKYRNIHRSVSNVSKLQCFDAVGWVTGRAPVGYL